jgi:hypothetical protein
LERAPESETGGQLLSSTQLSRHIRAPRRTIWDALLDARAIEAWRAPLPPGVSVSDNETGTRMALDKLAALVEAG